MNFVGATVGAEGRSIILDELGGETIGIARPLEAGREVIVGIRPEHALVSAATPQFHITVGVVESTESVTYISSADDRFTVVQTERSRVRQGDRLGLTIDPKLVHLFDPATGRRI